MARRTSSRYSRSWLLRVSLTAGMLVTAQLLIAPGVGLAASHGARPGSPAMAAGSSKISHMGNLDCNGHSPVQRPVKPGGIICAEVHLAPGGSRFEDNGSYIGHDEPTVQFYSNQPGSSTGIAPNRMPATASAATPARSRVLCLTYPASSARHLASPVRAT